MTNSCTWQGAVVNKLVLINKVALRKAWIILGWVTVCGQVYNLRNEYNQHQGQLSLPPSWGR